MYTYPETQSRVKRFIFHITTDKQKDLQGGLETHFSFTNVIEKREKLRISK